jgi:hypothetical protein
MTGITNIDTPELITRTAVEGSSARVTMSGSAESSAKVVVADFLQCLHESVTLARITEVVLDVRALSFMTASCFKAFVGWIERLESLAVEARYRIRFVYDEQTTWQSKTLGALATLGAGIVCLEASV